MKWIFKGRSRSELEPWGVAELPQPPDRILSIIGPGAIILGASIGSGEWLLGPAAFVKHSLSLLWVTLVASTLQTIFNTELLRYTLYTGEPIVIGFMRTRPGPTFWAWFYAALYFLQQGWPGWAGSAAGAIFFLSSGRMAGPEDARAVYWIGIGTFLLCVLILVFGGRSIERTLEILNWALIIAILGSLAALCLIFASPGQLLAAAAGFFGYDVRAGRFSFLPPGADWFLIGAFAAYSGMGGVANLTLSNYARDKGFGMGKVVGYIPAAVGGHKVRLAHRGIVFELSPESLARWRRWWHIVSVDQWGIFFSGAMLGMALPGILYTALIEPGREIRGLAIAAELANAISARGGAPLGLLVAMMSVWILFKTQLDILEGMTRAITDIIWSGSERVRRLSRGDVRRVYYSLLAAAVLWGIIALGLTQPITLLQLGANVAGVSFVISGLHVLRVNTKLLPAELRPPPWRQAALVTLALFYAFFALLWLVG